MALQQLTQVALCIYEHVNASFQHCWCIVTTWLLELPVSCSPPTPRVNNCSLGKVHNDSPPSPKRSDFLSSFTTQPDDQIPRFQQHRSLYSPETLDSFLCLFTSFAPFAFFTPFYFFSSHWPRCLAFVPTLTRVASPKTLPRTKPRSGPRTTTVAHFSPGTRFGLLCRPSTGLAGRAAVGAPRSPSRGSTGSPSTSTSRQERLSRTARRLTSRPARSLLCKSYPSDSTFWC